MRGRPIRPRTARLRCRPCQHPHPFLPLLLLYCPCRRADLEDRHDIKCIEELERAREEVQLREDAEEHARQEHVRQEVDHLVVAAEGRADHFSQLKEEKKNNTTTKEKKKAGQPQHTTKPS